MGSIPVTTRLKRVSAIKKTTQTSGAIDPESGIVEVGGSFQGEDIPSTTEDVMGEKTDFVAPKDKREKDPEKWEKTRKGICDGSIKGDKSKVNCDDVVVEQKSVKGKKGDSGDWEGTLKTGTTGDVLSAYDARVQSRTIKKQLKDIRRSKIREAKNKGIFTGDLRKQYKAEENKARKVAFEKAYKRGEAARASGRRSGSSEVGTGQRNMLQSELGGVKEQSKFLEDRARRGYKQKGFSFNTDEAIKNSINNRKR
tara:strand:- start:53 stop:814 length:762 start_codon:yes stop_codon:yes gene_type:complete